MQFKSAANDLHYLKLQVSSNQAEFGQHYGHTVTSWKKAHENNRNFYDTPKTFLFYSLLSYVEVFPSGMFLSVWPSGFVVWFWMWWAWVRTPRSWLSNLQLVSTLIVRIYTQCQSLPNWFDISIYKYTNTTSLNRWMKILDFATRFWYFPLTWRSYLPKFCRSNAFND